MTDEVYTFFKTNGFVFEMLLSVGLLIWSKDKRPRFWLRVLGVTGCMLLVSMLWGLLPFEIVWVRISEYISLFLVCIWGIQFCFTMKTNQALFFATVAGCVQHLVFKLSGTCEFLWAMAFGRSEWNIKYAYAVFVLPWFAVCYFLFARKISKYDTRKMDNRAVTVAMLGMLLTACLFQCMLDKYYFGMQSTLYTVFNMYAISSCGFLLFLLSEIANREKAEQDNLILKHLLHKQKEQMEVSKETINLINIKCHDLKKQIYTLGNRVPQEELNELQQNISIYDKAVRTGNEALDILLMEKGLFCEEHHIRFDYIADGEALAFMKPSDIYALFGNALDNAAEAVCKLADNRYIHMKISREKGMLMVHIENPCTGNLSFDDGLPTTTKGDTRYHGFGMKSIRMIVEKYHGFLAVQEHNGLFTLNFLLPLKEEETSTENPSN